MTRKTYRVESRTWNLLPRAVPGQARREFRGKPGRSVVESEFGTCQQDPDKLLARVLGPVGPLGQIARRACAARRHRAGVRARCERPGRPLRRVGSRLLKAPDEPVGAVGQELACDLLAVAEEQGLGRRRSAGRRSSWRTTRRATGRFPRWPRSVSRIGRTGKSAGRLTGSAVASRSEVASCVGVSGRTRATAKSDGRGGSARPSALPRAYALLRTRPRMSRRRS